MTDLYIHPQKAPRPEELESRNDDPMDWGGARMEPAGPGGKTTVVNANEMGILQKGLFEAMSMHQESPLGSTHDKYAVGIYGDTDSKYAD